MDTNLFIWILGTAITFGTGIDEVRTKKLLVWEKIAITLMVVVIWPILLGWELGMVVNKMIRLNQKDAAIDEVSKIIDNALQKK